MRKEASFISVATAVGLVVAALSGGMYVGALASDVETLQAAQEQQKEDHDTVVTLKNDVKHIVKQTDATKAQLDAVVAILNTIQTKINEE